VRRDNYPAGVSDADDEFWQDEGDDAEDDEPDRDDYGDQHD
jgi:hypothetical protein